MVFACSKVVTSCLCPAASNVASGHGAAPPGLEDLTAVLLSQPGGSRHPGKPCAGTHPPLEFSNSWESHAHYFEVPASGGSPLAARAQRPGSFHAPAPRQQHYGSPAQAVNAGVYAEAVESAQPKAPHSGPPADGMPAMPRHPSHPDVPRHAATAPQLPTAQPPPQRPAPRSQSRPVPNVASMPAFRDHLYPTAPADAPQAAAAAAPEGSASNPAPQAPASMPSEQFDALLATAESCAAAHRTMLRHNARELERATQAVAAARTAVAARSASGEDDDPDFEDAGGTRWKRQKRASGLTDEQRKERRCGGRARTR
jgi:hypothetical protein